MSDQTIAVVILTYNEELHLERAIRSVADVADEIFVIDSYSTDKTVEIAKAHGATVLQRAFDNQARQFNWALDTAEIRSDWIFRLDADEVVEGDLANEIRTRLPQLPRDVVGINLHRKHIFMGRWIRHGGRYPVTLLRIWRKGHGRVENRWMDEHVVIEGGHAITLKGGFADHNLNDLTYFIDKHNKYASREAVEIVIRSEGLFDCNTEADIRSATRQAAIKRWIKENLYNRLPFWAGPLAYFTLRMTVQLGFLDGREGLIYHFLQGYWYRFLVGTKALEFEQALATATGSEAKVKRLRDVSGLQI